MQPGTGTAAPSPQATLTDREQAALLMPARRDLFKVLPGAAQLLPITSYVRLVDGGGTPPIGQSLITETVPRMIGGVPIIVELTRDLLRGRVLRENLLGQPSSPHSIGPLDGLHEVTDLLVEPGAGRTGLSRIDGFREQAQQIVGADPVSDDKRADQCTHGSFERGNAKLDIFELNFRHEFPSSAGDAPTIGGGEATVMAPRLLADFS
jgi:hypothetical protein